MKLLKLDEMADKTIKRIALDTDRHGETDMIAILFTDGSVGAFVLGATNSDGTVVDVVDDPDAQGWETRRCVEAITRLFEVQP